MKNGPKECPSTTIREDELHKLIVKAFNDFQEDKEESINLLREILTNTLGENLKDELIGVQEQVNHLQKEIIDKASQNEDYDDLVDQVNTMKDKQTALEIKVARTESNKIRTKDLIEYLEKQEGFINEYDDKLVRRLIEKVIIYEDCIVVKFKSGEEIMEVRY